MVSEETSSRIKASNRVVSIITRTFSLVVGGVFRVHLCVRQLNGKSRPRRTQRELPELETFIANRNR